MEMFAEINGKRVKIAEGATVADARRQLPEVGGDQFLAEDPTAGTKALGEQERLRSGHSYWTIPRIVKGCTRP